MPLCTGPGSAHQASSWLATSSSVAQLLWSASGMASRFCGVSRTCGARPRVLAPAGSPALSASASERTRWCTAALAAPYGRLHAVGASAAAAPGRTRRPPGRSKELAAWAAATEEYTEDSTMARVAAATPASAAEPMAKPPATFTTASSGRPASRPRASATSLLHCCSGVPPPSREMACSVAGLACVSAPMASHWRLPKTSPTLRPSCPPAPRINTRRLAMATCTVRGVAGGTRADELGT
mmetsp:Transcript_25518/g.60187  ORF Transcript_25518/g.60187 Transcript_25518/m.60187 type:complete len:240 (+) Transcript_25518:200-919(+)